MSLGLAVFQFSWCLATSYVIEVGVPTEWQKFAHDHLAARFAMFATMGAPGLASLVLAVIVLRRFKDRNRSDALLAGVSIVIDAVLLAIILCAPPFAPLART
jgi:hypothetical protein